LEGEQDEILPFAQNEGEYENSYAPTVRQAHCIAVSRSYGLQDITLIPNPTTGELRIDNKGIHPLAIEVYDIYGRNVGTKFPSNELEGWQPWSLSVVEAQADGVVFNISHLTSGLYFVKITTEVGETVKKVVKM
jgi:Ca2+/Na+ antiporter